MGKSIFFTIIMALAAIPYASAGATIDPMVWSKDQWRSDLQKTQHVNTHRQNLRFPKRVITRIVLEKQIVRSAPSVAVFDVSPLARPKFIVIGAKDEAQVRVQTAPGRHRDCRGMLVLTWTGNKAVSRCHRGGPKPRFLPAG